MLKTFIWYLHMQIILEVKYAGYRSSKNYHLKRMTIVWSECYELQIEKEIKAKTWIQIKYGK